GDAYSLTTGDGAIAIVGTPGSAGGGGSLTAGVGGAGQITTAPQPGGKGGSWTITAGVGGASGGAASTAGEGGDVLIVAADAGATGAGVAGNKGRVAFTSGTTQYFLTAAGTAAAPALTTTATTIIEAINEVNAAAAEPSQTVVSVIATTGLTAGRAAYISAADVSSHTDANATVTSEVIGFVKTVGAAGTGEIVTNGIVNVAMVTGLNVSAGDVLFLGNPTIAGAAGQITNDVSGFTTGDTIYEVGVANENNAATSSDSLIEMVIRLGQRVVV
ncbi:MAG TPA: hypothetical protein VMW94_06420, partial [Actinomycetes bacterium]|nr:hypothetical protein [Actinomycetes bacterium]